LAGRSIGNYQVWGPIGQGGQGIVYLAEHPRIGRRVAIKVLRSELLARTDSAARFLAEARSATGIRSPHVVEVLDFGELEDGTPYYVMEWLEGRTLAAALLEEGRFPVERAVHVARGIGLALESAHPLGIVHCDLKPANVFLTSREGDPDYVKVLDFGIARFVRNDFPVDHLTNSTALLGTPSYMSPEQCRGGRRKVDQRSDIYALGVILYEMLTGRRPWHGGDFAEILLEKMTGQPEPPRAHLSTLPRELDAVVLRALEGRPERRFGDVSALLAALQPFDARSPLPTPLPTPPPAAPPAPTSKTSTTTTTTPPAPTTRTSTTRPASEARTEADDEDRTRTRSGYRRMLRRVLDGDFDGASPADRAEAVHKLIRACSVAAGAVAAQPIPLLDAALIAPIQVALVQGIGRIHGHRLDRRSVLEILNAFGAGLLAQNLAMAAAKLLPVFGSIASVSIAYALTHAVGEVSDHYFRHGRGASHGELKRMFKRIYKSKREEKMAEHRHDATLKERIEALRTAQQKGLLTEEEFQQKKEELLGSF
jgi:serine/threonine protein kinase/uncharacterized protein (DUF697 family)